MSTFSTPHSTTATADTVCVLFSHGRRLAKLIRLGRPIEDYDSARTFDIVEYSVPSLTVLSVILRRLVWQPTCCVVRGAIQDPMRTVRVRRLAHPDPKTGDLATLREVPRAWLAIDADNVGRPDDVPAADLPRCAGEVIKHLPAAFRGARCIVQATAGHGIKPGCRLRLWFWLSRPMAGNELKRWLRRTPIDHSIFNTSQPIYTAAPIFIGLTDHLPQRMIELPGEELVRVPPPISITEPTRKSRQQIPHYVGNNAQAALIQAAAAIMAAPEGERHRTLIRACCALTPLLRVGALAEPIAAQVVRGATEAAGWPNAGKIEAAIAWAFARPAECPFSAIQDV